MGQRIYYMKKVDSTNKVARSFAERGAEEGTVILAEEQSAGRGREGRVWHSPPGGVYLSVILRPRIHPKEAPPLALMVGLAASKAIGVNLGRVAHLKWPNDVLIDGKKIAGILLESSSTPEKLNWVVAGVGINLNVRLEDLPEDVRGTATSLLVEKGEEVDRELFLKDLLYYLDLLYLRFMDRRFVGMKEDWIKHSSTIGKWVRVSTPQAELEGVAEDLKPDGSLVLKNDKMEWTISTGDCLHLR